MPVIDIHNIRKRFRGSLVLDGLDMGVDGGQVVGLWGANGAGKTTLLRILATLIVPETGGGRVSGADLLREPHLVRRRIGLALVNERALYWRLDAHANLIFFARVRGIPRREAKRRAAEIVERIGLGPIARNRVGTWSAGQRQRLVIARALLDRPSLLLIDEPTRGLDDAGITAISRLFREAADDGTLVLYTTPEAKDLAHVRDRVLYLQEGRVHEPPRLIAQDQPVPEPSEVSP